MHKLQNFNYNHVRVKMSVILSHGIG